MLAESKSGAAEQNFAKGWFWNLTWKRACSLDWMVAHRPDGKNEELKEPETRMDVSLGTAFDMFVHITYASILFTYLGLDDIVAAIVLLAVGTKIVLFNPKFAWSSPKWVPEWVGRRVRPVVN